MKTLDEQSSSLRGVAARGVDDLKREATKYVFEINTPSHSRNDFVIYLQHYIDHLHAQGRIVPDGYVAVPLRLMSFLNGTGELEGVCFGEKNSYHKGNFWWRKYLPAAQKGDE